MVVLQNGMDVVEGGTGSYSETSVECDVDGTEEVSIKVEEAIDIKEEVSIKVEDTTVTKDEIPEAVSFPPIKTELEVRLGGGGGVRGGCISCLLPQKGNCQMTLNYSCFVFCFGCHISLEI
jgi:hypothetical protein